MLAALVTLVLSRTLLVHLLRAEPHLRPRLGHVVKVSARRDADRRQRRMETRHFPLQLDQREIGGEGFAEDPSRCHANFGDRERGQNCANHPFQVFE